MKVRLSMRGLAEDPALADAVERRAQFALGRFAPRLRHLLVSLDVGNGPKGGLGLKCRVELKLRSGDCLLVEERDLHSSTAVDRALDRSARKLARHLEREREREHMDHAGGRNR